MITEPLIATDQQANKHLVIRQGLSSGGERHSPPSTSLRVPAKMPAFAKRGREREGMNMFHCPEHHVPFLLCHIAENTPLEGTAAHAFPEIFLCLMHHI